MHRTSRGSEIPVLRVRYLLTTAFGLLTISLTSFRAARNAEWERLFDAMAQTAQLGHRPHPPGYGGVHTLGHFWGCLAGVILLVRRVLRRSPHQYGGCL